ncbi:MAG: DUF3866 family protein [Solirubrobacterales bacterium]
MIEVQPSRSDGEIDEMVVDVDGVARPAFADVSMVGVTEAGDSVVVNVEAVDLDLGSGGRDVVLVNLTRGLNGEVDSARHVMKLNYTALQTGVAPIESSRLDVPIASPTAIFQLHGQLAPVAWAALNTHPGLKLGYVQTGGGALPGKYSSTVKQLRERGLLCDHLTAAPAYGGEGEAMSTIGALHSGLRDRGWDAAVVGPGPGIIGSGTPLGHGGMNALDSAHCALALGCDAVLVARASSGDPRERHRGVSHHTRTVLELLLAPVTVALSQGTAIPDEAARHDARVVDVEIEKYVASGLPSRTMGRDWSEDRQFFECALAGGEVLADLLRD